ncbi:MAG TPA: hypothetical protein QF646_01280 [Candidatus Poseidoniales archaeon]|nr:hypothetical protein [Candidatus Poseidoniales archaeon]
MSGEVSITYKVMLDSSMEDPNAEEICEEVIRVSGVQAAGTKPLAFGMKYIEAVCKIEDGEGKVDELEDALKAIDGVGELEVLEMGRLM